MSDEVGTMRCTSCGKDIDALIYFWPGLGLLCTRCHAAVRRGTIVPRGGVDPIQGPASPIGATYAKHVFRAVTYQWGQGHTERYYQCPDCFGLLPFRGGMGPYLLEAGTCPGHPKDATETAGHD